MWLSNNFDDLMVNFFGTLLGIIGAYALYKVQKRDELIAEQKRIAFESKLYIQYINKKIDEINKTRLSQANSYKKLAEHMENTPLIPPALTLNIKLTAQLKAFEQLDYKEMYNVLTNIYNNEKAHEIIDDLILKISFIQVLLEQANVENRSFLKNSFTSKIQKFTDDTDALANTISILMHTLKTNKNPNPELEEALSTHLNNYHVLISKEQDVNDVLEKFIDPCRADLLTNFANNPQVIEIVLMCKNLAVLVNEVKNMMREYAAKYQDFSMELRDDKIKLSRL